MKKTVVFIVSGPGGVGKTTLAKKAFLRKSIKGNFIRGITATTRAPRKGEKEGRDYYFIPKEKFIALKKKGYFLESEQVVDNFYGTPRMLYTQAKKDKKGLVLCIDVKGGVNLKNTIKDRKVITIFITASEKNLLERMKGRCDDPKKIKERTVLAKKEMEYLDKYDYVVENCQLKDATDKLCEILVKESGIELKPRR